MRLAAGSVVGFAVAGLLGCAGPLEPRSSSSQAPATTGARAVEDSQLAHSRRLVDESRSALATSSYALAREKLADAVNALLERSESTRDAAGLALLETAARLAGDAQDLHTARRAWTAVIEARTASGSDEDSELQWARLRLSRTIRALGDLEGARALEEKVLEIWLRKLPDDHDDLQAARGDLALTLRELGEVARAHTLQEKVLEIRLRTLPDDHPDLQRARGNLAGTLYALGDVDGARELEEEVFEAMSRTLPDDHPDLQTARQNLAITLSDLGQFSKARALEEKVLAVRSRTLPADHPDLQWARGNLAATLLELGDPEGGRVLMEQVVEVLSRTLPEDHADLLWARGRLAVMLSALGDFQGARVLLESVREIYARTVPAEHLELQRASQNLAVAIRELGDVQGARALEEEVLDVRSRVLPDDHIDLQAARLNLAVTLKAFGDDEGARALEERVLEVFSRTLPDDHPDLQKLRGNLAITLKTLGDLQGARELEEAVLEVYSRTLREEHPDLQAARGNLAGTLYLLGDLAGSRALLEDVLAMCSRTLSDDHSRLQRARANLAGTILVATARAARPAADQDDTIDPDTERKQVVRLIGELARANARSARELVLSVPSREADERCVRLVEPLGFAISVSLGYGVFDPLRELDSDVFAFSERTRGAAIGSAAMSRRAATSPKYTELRDDLQQASADLAALARSRASSADIAAARERREAAERELIDLAQGMGEPTPGGMVFDVGALASVLDADAAAVGFRRFVKQAVEADRGVREIESLCAFVVRGTTLALVDLGPIAPIENAIEEWREAIGAADGRGASVAARSESVGVSEKGDRARHLVFDPLEKALGPARHLILALDDVLHLVPFDALPTDATGGQLLGDRLRIEIRSTLTELLDAPASSDGDLRLVCVGDVGYDESDGNAPAILRGGAWSLGFTALPASREEIDGLEELFGSSVGADDACERLVEHDATKPRVIASARRASFLHIATHGWFAPESIRSWSDPEESDKLSGLVFRQSEGDQVRGMNPMLLCGLALAGANSPEDSSGRAFGLITAEELAALDLSECELAVLSACDTNVGERRAGQGVASFQRALQMAGARSVITSLWKVPDEATKDLMLDFYRRMWIEKKPKAQALWEAKKKLRDEKDERGARKYTTRDWAAWVLTGNPG